MTHRQAAAWCVALACIAIVGHTAPARAQGTAPGGLTGLIRTFSALGLEQGMLEPGFISHAHTLEDSLGSRHYMLVNELQIGYGVSRNLELGVTVPLRAWRVSPQDTTNYSPSNVWGFGDITASAKLKLPLPGNRLALAGLGRVTFATGSKSRGYTVNTTDYELGGALTLDFSDLDSFVPTRFHVNTMYRWNRNESQGIGMSPLPTIPQGGSWWPPAYPASVGRSQRWNDHLLLRAGIEFRTRVLVFFTEWSADWLHNVDEANFRDNVMFLTPGATLRFRNGLNLKFAADISLQAPDPPTTYVPELPTTRAWVGLTWAIPLANRDRDYDGIPDKRDDCPREAEDYDGHQDDDGCPDPDNDGDGIPDSDDLAPDLAEDVDGFEDEDGRPDLDNDGDGIPDNQDQCPNEAEDFDGDRDTDGCPDVIADADADGVPDAADACPNEAEDIDGFEDTDGCPDPDNDGDGILDVQDACPDLAETANGYLDEDGCPDSNLYQGGEVIPGLDFETGSAALTTSAVAALRPLLAAMQGDPTLQIEVRGYTDDRGSASRNVELSQQRANAVRDWLVAQGIPARRVQARGLGSANPIADNGTPDGRAQNRRIEVWGR